MGWCIMSKHHKVKIISVYAEVLRRLCNAVLYKRLHLWNKENLVAATWQCTISFLIHSEFLDWTLHSCDMLVSLFPKYGSLWFSTKCHLKFRRRWKHKMVLYSYHIIILPSDRLIAIEWCFLQTRQNSDTFHLFPKKRLRWMLKKITMFVT